MMDDVNMMNESLADLIKRLVAAGFKRKQIARLGLPTWWETWMERDEDLLYEAKLILARSFGLDIRQVLNPNAVIDG